VVGIVIVWILLAGNPAPAATAIETKETLKVSGVDREFVTYPAKALTITTDCVHAGKKLSCGAYTAYTKRYKIKITPGELQGGANPGTYKCQKLGGTVLIGTQENHDEMSVCKFDDGSLLDIGSFDGLR
jgi:putative hemolysin